MPFSVREGINIFLAGFVPTENLRFREEELNFKMSTSTGELRWSFQEILQSYLNMVLRF